MALRRNSILAGILIAGAVLSTPALADDSTITNREPHKSNYLDDNYIYDYMNHRDSITIGLGDAPTSNIIIQNPTPWPWYVNKTRIHTTGSQGISALDAMMSRSGASSSSSSTSGSMPTSGIAVGTVGGGGTN